MTDTQAIPSNDAVPAFGLSSPETQLTPDLCIIGAGAAGLSVAAVASQLGLDVVLIEKHKMGGECLNYGCVPSKALLAAAHEARRLRFADRFGLGQHLTGVDFAKVHQYVQRVIESIAPNDSVARFQGLGVTVLKGAAQFVDRKTVQVNTTAIVAKKVLICTGSHPVVPQIPGLADVPYLTNETIFDLTTCPKHLIVIGGGAIGIEMAQAMRWLGADVTVVDAGRILPKDDPECAGVLRNRLRRDGVQFRENASIAQVFKDDDGSIAMHMYLGDNPETLKGSHVLIAAGRAPNVVHLGLDKAGVAFDVRQGIMTDAALRTNKKHIYALGDVACPRGQAPMQFTHIAGQHATVFIKKALFKIPAKVAQKTVPWVTYTDPELAHVGLREHEAVATYGAHKVRVLRWSFGENDRAQAENTTEGLIKVMVRPNGKILGATIVGPRAGELIQPWILAISENIKIAAMAALIVPYPTLGEVSKRAAGQFFVPKLFSEKTKRIVRFLMRF